MPAPAPTREPKTAQSEMITDHTAMKRERITAAAAIKIESHIGEPIMRRTITQGLIPFFALPFSLFEY